MHCLHYPAVIADRQTVCETGRNTHPGAFGAQAIKLEAALHWAVSGGPVRRSR